jgi:hypothetical protein
MLARQPSPRAGKLGQSLVETVIFLPVLVVIFLGMFYMKGLLNTKMRAVEAARYVTWENTWIPREGIAKDVIEDGRPRGQKNDTTLRNELVQVGLGAYLFRVQGTKRKEALDTYLNRVQPGSLPMIVGVPVVVTQLFGGSAGFGGGNTSQFSNNPDRNNPPQQNGGSSSGSGPLSGLGLGNGLNDLLNIVGGAAFTVYGVMANQTKWGTESDESVITSQVVYHYQAGGTTLFVPRFIAEQSSILSHPFNIKRSDDQEEHHRLAGDGSSCEDVNNIGHIFDLWLFPSGFGAGAGVTRAPKCAFAAIATVANFLGALNPFSPGVPLRIPNGTLKEYPEMDLPASAGNGGTGNSGGSGPGGGNTQPPRS